MLNLRKLKQDFSSTALEEGKHIYEENKVISAKILHLDKDTLKISATILGQYKKIFRSEVEIDRHGCEIVVSVCDCSCRHDCQHLAALLFYLDANLYQVVSDYSKEREQLDKSENESLNDEEEERDQWFTEVKKAQTKEEERKEKEMKRELLKEYTEASLLLADSPFFVSSQREELARAELAILFNLPKKEERVQVPIQLAIRFSPRCKLLRIAHTHEFIEAIDYQEPVCIGNTCYRLGLHSFEQRQQEIVRLLINQVKIFYSREVDHAHESLYLDFKCFGMLLHKAHQIHCESFSQHGCAEHAEKAPIFSGFFKEDLDHPIRFSPQSAQIKFGLEYLQSPAKKILLNPSFVLEQRSIPLESVLLLECPSPGLIYEEVYYPFPSHITRQHLRHLTPIRNITIPEPLFGTFIENSLPELAHFAAIDRHHAIVHCPTLPYTKPLKAICDLSFLNGELEASLTFLYDQHEIPSHVHQLQHQHLLSFVTEEGILARNLVAERKLLEQLFQNFTFLSEEKVYVSKVKKKIIEFMTETIPKHQHQVTFNCPKNLLDQFVYDETTFHLRLVHTQQLDHYEIHLQVEGALQGVSVDQLWDCVIANHAYLELVTIPKKRGKKQKHASNLTSKILVINLDNVKGLAHLFDELGIESLTNHTLKRPLWSLVDIDESKYRHLPIVFQMTQKLKDMREQMLGNHSFAFSPIPEQIRAELRPYQKEGVQWLERLRFMHLNGILADDMGLGKTLQAIVALTQLLQVHQGNCLVICPTSLLYNWEEECHKFNPSLRVLVINGMPNQRKRLIQQMDQYHVIITSYSLLQKDIDLYHQTVFSYMVLDEAQHIKNRGTRNAKSVKMVQAEHRLILSGTPIENSLEELWSLFDFLMPGFLGTYERFLERYVRAAESELSANLQILRKKIAPFILRRMKSDVLDDLPPIFENVYHTQLTKKQRELYVSYAQSARDELTKLVERDGFDKVQIHVLATLTRLKQICCHPALFAKEKAEEGDSAKYDMLLELVQTLIEGGHKIVIFSQYTQMLKIMRTDFEGRGIALSYLDGSSKNRLDTIKEFNKNPKIPIFLVSLKAGGTGINLVGADTVIHYDFWWNPAVQKQATNRAHRIGQKMPVSLYKLVTSGTVEEKIIELQKRKQHIVKTIVGCDDEAIKKLTWQDVLELLQT